MSEKKCFIKVSWQNPEQPLSRIHRNNECYLDFSKDIVVQVETEFWYSEYKDFTVDFILVLD